MWWCPTIFYYWFTFHQQEDPSHYFFSILIFVSNGWLKKLYWEEATNQQLKIYREAIMKNQNLKLPATINLKLQDYLFARWERLNHTSHLIWNTNCVYKANWLKILKSLVEFDTRDQPDKCVWTSLAQASAMLWEGNHHRWPCWIFFISTQTGNW